MSIQIAVSDALNRRVPRFAAERYTAFQLVVANIAKGRAQGQKVHTSAFSGRVFYEYKTEPYTLYYSVDPKRPNSLVFEEFLSAGEENLIMDLFAEGAD
ncbi:hypothetical protein JW859_03155 [bacterium]|nr:hypothetical protein [bacterium]